MDTNIDLVEETNSLINCIIPSNSSNAFRKDIVEFIESTINKEFSLKICESGSFPLQTYLPESDLDLIIVVDDVPAEISSSFNNKFLAIFNSLCRSIDEVDENGGVFTPMRIKSVEYINARTKLCHCVVNSVGIDLTINQMGALSSMSFLEEADRVIGHNNLYKRCIILIKSWCLHESIKYCGVSLLGSKHGFLSSYSVCIMVLHLFSCSNVLVSAGDQASLNGDPFDVEPLHVLKTFLSYYSSFPWSNHVLTLRAAVPIQLGGSSNTTVSQMPNTSTSLTEKQKKILSIQEEYQNSVQSFYDKEQQRKREEAEAEHLKNPSPESGKQAKGHSMLQTPFSVRHCNIQDPVDIFNNLGIPISPQALQLITMAFTKAHQHLAYFFDLAEWAHSVKSNQTGKVRSQSLRSDLGIGMDSSEFRAQGAQHIQKPSKRRQSSQSSTKTGGVALTNHTSDTVSTEEGSSSDIRPKDSHQNSSPDSDKSISDGKHSSTVANGQFCHDEWTRSDVLNRTAIDIDFLRLFFSRSYVVYDIKQHYRPRSMSLGALKRSGDQHSRQDNRKMEKLSNNMSLAGDLSKMKEGIQQCLNRKVAIFEPKTNAPCKSDITTQPVLIDEKKATAAEVVNSSPQDDALNCSVGPPLLPKDESNGSISKCNNIGSPGATSGNNKRSKKLNRKMGKKEIEPILVKTINEKLNEQTTVVAKSTDKNDSANPPQITASKSLWIYSLGVAVVISFVVLLIFFSDVIFSSEMLLLSQSSTNLSTSLSSASVSIDPVSVTEELFSEAAVPPTENLSINATFLSNVMEGSSDFAKRDGKKSRFNLSLVETIALLSRSSADNISNSNSNVALQLSDKMELNKRAWDNHGHGGDESLGELAPFESSTLACEANESCNEAALPTEPTWGSCQQTAVVSTTTLIWNTTVTYIKVGQSITLGSYDLLDSSNNEKSIPVNTKKVTSSRYLVAYQWEKDGIPVLRNSSFVPNSSSQESSLNVVGSDRYNRPFLNLIRSNKKDSGRYVCKEVIFTCQKSGQLSSETALFGSSGSREEDGVIPSELYHELLTSALKQQENRKLAMWLMSDSAGGDGARGCTRMPPAVSVIAMSNIMISSPPFSDTREFYVNVKSGSALVLHFEVVSDPPPVYQWYKNGLALAGRTGRDFVEEKAKKSHSGTYSCEMINIAGKFMWLEATVSVV